MTQPIFSCCTPRDIQHLTPDFHHDGHVRFTARGSATDSPPPLPFPLFFKTQVSPIIDTGVLGLPPPPPLEPEIVTEVAVNVNADGTVDDGTVVDAEVMREESWAAGFAPDLGGATAGDDSGSGGYSPAGFRAGADFNVPVKEGGGTRELTVRALRTSCGLVALFVLLTTSYMNTPL